MVWFPLQTSSIFSLSFLIILVILFFFTPCVFVSLYMIMEGKYKF